MNVDLKTVKKAYFLGIGGIGVSALARMMLYEGKEVGGTDTTDSDLIRELQAAGARISIGNDLSHIPDDIDLLVYSIAVPKFSPEFFEEAKKKSKASLSYPETLSLISKDKYTIAIAGTHGKTTTTAMVAKILIDAGLDPTVIVGSILKDAKSNFIAGKSKYLVVEACEYCRSFLEINPTVIGITTIDNDHLDYYKDENDILAAFREFAEKLPSTGALVGNEKDLKIQEVFKAFSGKTIDASVYYSDNLHLKQPGRHNRQNASIALAIADHLGIEKDIAEKAIEEFSGTWRRFEYKGKTKTGAMVYDDYGHHPAEIKATLQGAREMFPDKKITLIFQPHLYSRTKFLLGDFAHELSKSDYVLLLPIYAAREENDPSISSEILLEEVKKKNPMALLSQTFEDAEKMTSECATEKDVLITMGAGDVYKIGEHIIDEGK